MNIDELEKLARAAKIGTWYDAGWLNTATNYDEHSDFIAAASPAAILELISINRELVAALELIKEMVIVNLWSIGFTMEVMDKALARANGEINE